VQDVPQDIEVGPGMGLDSSTGLQMDDVGVQVASTRLKLPDRTCGVRTELTGRYFQLPDGSYIQLRL
jgi:hypothetical protein